MKWLDKLPLLPLVIVSLALGMAPFVPEPHLLEKLKMLVAGELTAVIDVFDLIFHGIAPVLLVLKLFRMSKKQMS